jgi:hypothetical protein
MAQLKHLLFLSSAHLWKGEALKPEPSQHHAIFQDLRIRACDSRFCEPLLPQMVGPKKKLESLKNGN